MLVQTASSSFPPVVTVTNLVKQFGRFAALRGVTAEFQPARLYAILGDNGAGKTTLLRMLAGLSVPTRGSLSVLGASNPREVCAEIGYMAHPSLLYDEMSAIENLCYFARLYGIRDPERSRNLVRRANLDPQLNRPIGQYSQGMRQRVSLVRALLNDPKLVLLDEPFSNVDVGSAREMVRFLGDLRDQGRTIFVITHQASFLEDAADEFVWMAEGQIVNRSPSLSATEAR
jgi:ABC-type multidrug transport system ATPase subunit